jgi:hypothetical protein
MPNTATPGARLTRLAGLCAGVGGTGTLGLLGMTTHKTADVIAAAGVAALTVITSGVVRIVEARYANRAAIIKAQASAAAQAMRASGDLCASTTNAQLRAELLRAGLDPACTRQAAEMLRQQNIDANLPPGRRLNDDALEHLLQLDPSPEDPDDPPREGPTGLVA